LEQLDHAEASIVRTLEVFFKKTKHDTQPLNDEEAGIYSTVLRYFGIAAE